MFLVFDFLLIYISWLFKLYLQVSSSFCLKFGGFQRSTSSYASSWAEKGWNVSPQVPSQPCRHILFRSLDRPITVSKYQCRQLCNSVHFRYSLSTQHWPFVKLGLRRASVYKVPCAASHQRCRRQSPAVTVQRPRPAGLSGKDRHPASNGGYELSVASPGWSVSVA